MHSACDQSGQRPISRSDAAAVEGAISDAPKTERRHPTSGSDPPEQHKNDNDDQDGAEDADAAVTEAIAVAAEATTEATEQRNDENDEENGPERHDFCSLVHLQI